LQPPVGLDGAVDLVSGPADERGAELRVQRCRYSLFNGPGQDREPSAPGKQRGGACCLLVVEVAGDPALVEDQQQARVRSCCGLLDVPAEPFGRFVGQGAVGVVKQFDVADA